MFGYVTIYKPELKIKEYEAYKGVYCTLCKEMGREYGLLSRFLLNYDGAFFVVYKLGISDTDTSAEKSRCTFNPCKKCFKISCKSNVYSLASAITVLLAYYKLQDNIADGSLLKKILLRIIKPYFSRLKRKAEKKYPDLAEKISRGMEKQASVEHDDNVSLDLAADSTAQMLSAILSYGESEKNKELSKHFGYMLGRAVYFLDAFDDYRDDVKNNTFNPFKNDENFTDTAIMTVRMTIGELQGIRQQICFNKFSPIVDNIICDGLDFQMQKIVKKYRGDDCESI